jgi:DNA (cytosine-5)-methyltransferase 1
MRIGSLFSGIGGLELGLEWAGVGHTVWQVEYDPFCRDVLAKHWPDAQRFTDVREVGAHNLEAVDVICGGYPCQPFSSAGLRRGDADERHLWPEFARILGEVRPRFAVLENVAGHLALGFGRVLGDLADLGYDAEWRVLTGREVGAPHLRPRVFVIAYNHGNGPQGVGAKPLPWVHGFSGWQDVRGVEDLRKRPGFPPSLFRGGRDGVPDWMDRVKACGNAVIPQVAQIVGHRVIEIANALDTTRERV